MRPVLLIVAAVLLIRLPFLDQPVQGDDIYYLKGAEHAQIDLAHPSHARYVFQGEMVDMRGHSHPPLNSWVLAAILAAVGDVREAPFHAVYTGFSLIAALAMWSLERQFTGRPLEATLLFLATPAFVVNGNSLESDVPFLTLWLASIAMFVSAADRRSTPRLLAAAAVMGVTGMAAYQSVMLIPVLGAYLWLYRRDWIPGWLALVAPAAVIGTWQLIERLSSGAAPASMLAGYLSSRNFQALASKLQSAAALTAHAGWLVFPALVWLAFRRVPKAGWAIVAAGAAGAMALDWHPLFWVSFGTGILLLVWCVLRARQDFLAAWMIAFFAAALVLFFAGSARYLLPVAAPVAILVSRELSRRVLLGGFAAQMALSLGLATVNYDHWDGYREFAAEMRKQTESRRVWINSEWGLCFYLEADGGLPLQRGQAVRPGEMVVTSRLAYPSSFSTGGGVPARYARMVVDSAIPLRLIGLTARSAWSTATLGFRPFDIDLGPIDVVTAELILEKKPEAEFLAMNAPEAPSQIVSGLDKLEHNAWRWMSGQAVILLKRPSVPRPLEVSFTIPDNAPARRVTLLLDGAEAASATYPKPGSYTLSTRPIAPGVDAATVTILVDQTFRVPADRRELGMVLVSVGFRERQ